MNEALATAAHLLLKLNMRLGGYKAILGNRSDLFSRNLVCAFQLLVLSELFLLLFFP